MAKINFELLRERIHWIDAYASGSNRAEVAEQFAKEGATVNTVRTVTDAAKTIGLISGSHASTGGGGVTMNVEARADLMSGDAPASSVRPKAPSPVEKLRPKTPAIDISPLQLEMLRSMADERIDREKGLLLRSGEPQGAPTSVRLDAGLWAALVNYAELEGIKRSEAMNRAIEALLSRSE
jgi:hypothetical protein